MKKLIVCVLMACASSAYAADCVKNLRGQEVCANGQEAATYNPNTGTATTAQRQPGGATTAQNSNGSKAAYNPNTGRAAAQQTNSNGVATTKTSNGAQSKTKNGMGVAEGPGGEKCAKGKNEQGCTK